MVSNDILEYGSPVKVRNIKQVGMALRWNQKDKILILQQSWAGIERQTCIMG